MCSFAFAFVWTKNTFTTAEPVRARHWRVYVLLLFTIVLNSSYFARKRRCIHLKSTTPRGLSCQECLGNQWKRQGQHAKHSLPCLYVCSPNFRANNTPNRHHSEIQMQLRTNTRIEVLQNSEFVHQNLWRGNQFSGLRPGFSELRFYTYVYIYIFMCKNKYR